LHLPAAGTRPEVVLEGATVCAELLHEGGVILNLPGGGRMKIHSIGGCYLRVLGFGSEDLTIVKAQGAYRQDDSEWPFADLDINCWYVFAA
jgi:hypothetical protein